MRYLEKKQSTQLNGCHIGATSGLVYSRTMSFSKKITLKISFKMNNVTYYNKKTVLPIAVQVFIYHNTTLILHLNSCKVVHYKTSVQRIKATSSEILTCFSGQTINCRIINLILTSLGHN